MFRLLLVCLLAITSTSAFAQTTAPSPTTAPATNSILPEAPRAYDQGQVDRWVQAMRPVVERVTGRTFKRAPAARVVTRDELLEAIVGDGMHQLELRGQIEDPERLRLELTLGYLGTATGLVGFYSHADREILLPAGNLEPVLHVAEVDATRVEPIMKLVIAHELAHALHDQHLDVDQQIARVRTTDQNKALHATREGFAMLVQELVAAEIGATEANADLVRAMSLEGIEDESQLATARRRYRERYAAGWSFFQARRKAGATMDDCWQILAEPPRIYAQIQKPATYGERVEEEIDADRLFAGIGDLFEGDDWQELIMPVSAEQVGQTFAPVGAERAKEITDAVSGAHTLVLMRRMPTGLPVVRSVTVIDLKDPAYGPRMDEHAAALRDEQFGRLRGLAEGNGMTMTNAHAEPIAGLEAVTSRLDQTVLSPPEDQPGPTATSLALARARRGGSFVQFVANGTAVDEATVARAIRLVLERVDGGGEAMVPVAQADLDDPIIRAIASIDALLSAPEWSHRFEPVTADGFGAQLRAQLGPDAIPAIMALETSLERGQMCTVERRRDGAMATVVVLEHRDDDSARVLADAILLAMKRRFQDVEGLPVEAVNMDEPTQRTLEGGIVLDELRFEITVPGGEVLRASMHTARRGAVLAHVFETDGVLSGDQVVPYLAGVLKSVEKQ